MSRIDELEKMFNDFRMIGQDGITTHGSLHAGYAVHAECGGVPASTGFPTPIPPTPPPGCTFRDCTELSTVTVSTDGSVSNSGDCSFSHSYNPDDVTFNRINYADDWDPGFINQFKAWIDPDTCFLVLAFYGPDADPYNYLHRTIENDNAGLDTCSQGACTPNPMDVGGGDLTGHLISGADILVSSTSTVDFYLFTQIIVSCLPNCSSSPSCGCEGGGTFDPTTLSYTPADVSGLIGSYTQTFHDAEGDCVMDASVTITIA